MILLNPWEAHNPVAGAGRLSSLVASLEEFVSLTMLKWRVFNRNIVEPSHYYLNLGHARGFCVKSTYYKVMLIPGPL